MGIEISFILGLFIALVAVRFFDLPEFVRVYGPKSIIKRARNARLLRNRLAQKRIPRSRGLLTAGVGGSDADGLIDISKNTAIITCYFNPANLLLVERNYRRFMQEVEWWGRKCFSAELAFTGQEWPSASAFIQLRAGEKQMLWQRERLLNLIVERLPSSYDRIAVIDPTILLLNGSALRRAEALLETESLVGLCRDIHSVDERGTIVATRREDVHGVRKRDELVCDQPGAAFTGGWIARREVFPLYDRCVYGLGQALSLSAWRGTNPSSFILSPDEQAYYGVWANQAFSRVRGRVTSVEGACIDFRSSAGGDALWGRRRNESPKLEFDPSAHIGIDEHGLLAWQEITPLNLMKEVRATLCAPTLSP